MRYLLIGLPLIVLPDLGLASPAPCTGLTTQSDISSCMAGERDKEHQAMQATTEAYMAALEPNDRRLFQKAQAAWQSYIEATCQFSSAPLEGGSMQGADTSQCLTFLTIQRRQLMERQITCERQSLRTDCLTGSQPESATESPSTEHKPVPSAEDIDRLTTYGVALGKGIACKASGVSEASRKVGQWMDKNFPPGSDDQKTYLPVLTLGIEATMRLQMESPSESCSSVREAFAGFPWP